MPGAVDLVQHALREASLKAEKAASRRGCCNPCNFTCSLISILVRLSSICQLLERVCLNQPSAATHRGSAEPSNSRSSASLGAKSRTHQGAKLRKGSQYRNVPFCDTGPCTADFLEHLSSKQQDLDIRLHVAEPQMTAGSNHTAKRLLQPGLQRPTRTRCIRVGWACVAIVQGSNACHNNRRQGHRSRLRPRLSQARLLFACFKRLPPCLVRRAKLRWSSLSTRQIHLGHISPLLGRYIVTLVLFTIPTVRPICNDHDQGAANALSAAHVTRRLHCDLRVSRRGIVQNSSCCGDASTFDARFRKVGVSRTCSSLLKLEGN